MQLKCANAIMTICVGEQHDLDTAVTSADQARTLVKQCSSSSAAPHPHRIVLFVQIRDLSISATIMSLDDAKPHFRRAAGRKAFGFSSCSRGGINVWLQPYLEDLYYYITLDK
jgi:hypothetical protein